MAANTRTSSNHNRFGKRCGCLNHEIFTENTEIYLLSASTHQRRLSYKTLVKRGLLSVKQKWICSGCLAYSQTNFCQANVLDSSASSSILDTSTQSTESLVDDDPEPATAINALEKCVSIISSLGNWETLTKRERDLLTTISKKLGDIISSDIYSNSKNSSLIYKDSERLNTIEPLEWLKTQNVLLNSFLSSAASINSEEEENCKKINALVHSVEQVQYARNLSAITPFAFKRNLIIYSITKSKLATQLTGSWESAGAYSTILNFFQSPSEPSLPQSKSDVHITFDNNQKVGHSSGRIREGSQVPVSICTATTYITPKPESELQQREDLMPGNWCSPTVTEDVLDAVTDLEENHMTTFRTYRTSYLSDILARVAKEQQGETGRDYIDISVQNSENNHLVCAKCSHVYPKTQARQVCPNCREDPNLYVQTYDPYFRTESQHSAQTPEVHVGEPCMVNPNGKKAVLEVVKHLKDVCKVPTERKWIVVWTDGVPYVYLSHLQDSIFVCEACGVLVDSSVTTIEEHTLEEHPGAQPMSHTFLDFILHRPGPGHIEMNMAKTLLAFLWHPMLKYIAPFLGFRSPKAQEVLRGGIDHHRSRQVLEMSLEAISCELVVPFVQQCFTKGTSNSRMTCSVANYFDWISSSVEDPVYMFLFHFCFNFLLAFKLYNEAVRKNNHANMMAARVAFAPLFYSRHHPKYQELHLRDLIQRVQCPPEIHEHICQTEAFSVSGSHNTGQGADFIQEEANKSVKSFLPPKIPSEKDWINISRKVDSLVDMKNKSLMSVGIKSGYDATKRTNVKLSNEVTLLRREIRSQRYTCQPDKHRQMCSIDGKRLDGSLGNIKFEANKCFSKYRAGLLESGQYKSTKPDYICFTPEERTKKDAVESKTKREIETLIRSILDTMPDRAIANEHLISLPKVMKKKRAEILFFYYTVASEFVEQCDSIIVENTDSDDL